MKKSLLILIISVSCCIQAYSQHDGVKFKVNNLEYAFTKARAEKKFVFMYITSIQCVPCIELEYNIMSSKIVGDYVNDNFVTVKLMDDDERAISISEALGINSLPAVIIMDSKGSVIGKIIGADPTPDDFLISIDNILVKHEQKMEKKMEKEMKREMKNNLE